MVVSQVAARLRWTRSRPARTAASHRRPDRPHLGRTGRRHRRHGSPTTPPARVGRPGHRRRHDQRLHPPAAVLAPTAQPDPARRPAPTPRAGRSPPATSRSRSSTCTTCRERAQRFVVGVDARRRNRPQGGGRAGQPAVHHDRRAQQVRTAGGQQPDQGRAAGHRRARPLPRHHPDRRPADRQRGGTADRVELQHQGRRAGSTRPRPADPSTASCRPASGTAPPWPSPAPCSSASRRSRCRCPSSSPSPPGPPGRPNARRHPPPAPAEPTARDAFNRLPHGPVDDDSRPSATVLTATSHEGGLIMKLLHTSDWHVGKTLKGRNRLDEQKAVIAQIIGWRPRAPARRRADRRRPVRTCPPSAEAQQLVVRTLLARAGRASGHRHRRKPRQGTDFRRLPAVDAPAGITLVGAVRTADQGGVVSFDARSTGERGGGGGAAVPVPAVRGAGRPADRPDAGGECRGTYDDMVREVLANLAEPFTAGRVNVVMAHLTVTGGTTRRRRAGRAVDLRVQRAGRDLPDRRALRGPGSPAPAADRAGGRAGALLRGAVGRRLRRAGQHPRGVPDRGGPDHPRQDHRHADHGGPPAADRSRHRRPNCSPIPTAFGDDFLRLPGGPGRVRRHARASADALPNALEVRIDPQFAVSAAHRPARRSTAAPDARRAVRRILRGQPGRRPAGATGCSTSCTTTSPPGGRDRAPRSPGHERLRRLPGPDRRRLHRRRLLRPGRTDRLRQVDRHRRA